jgi:hypothetical protein
MYNSNHFTTVPITNQVQKQNTHTTDYLFYAVIIITSKAGLQVNVQFTL